MGRIRSETKTNGRKLWTLFDSGARNTYIRRKAARGLDLKGLSKSRSVDLGGKSHRVKQVCWIEGDIDGHPLDLTANVIDEIGTDEDGRPIDILFGALAMQQWGIRLDLQKEKIDWSRYTRDFVEY
jgi:hypothetical protein